MAIHFINTALLLACLATLLIVYRKIKCIDCMTWNIPALDDKIKFAELRLYRQLEALHNLNALIKPPVPLPPLRQWAGSPDFLLELAKSALSNKPQTIVECSSGSSTLVTARCCQLNGFGHVYSLEHEPAFAEATRRNLRDSGLDEWATVIDAPLKDHHHEGQKYPWYDISQLPGASIDLLVIDGPPAELAPMARYPAGPELFPRLSNRALVLLDDADRPDEEEIVKRWVRAFPQIKARHLQTEKGLCIIHCGE